MTNRKWTGNLLQELKRKADGGESLANLAFDYGVSTARIQQILKIEERRSKRAPTELDELPIRIANALQAVGLGTAAAVRAALDRDDFYGIQNIGPLGVHEIRKWLAKQGLLGDKEEFVTCKKTETIQRTYWTCTDQTHRHPTQKAAIHCMQMERRKAANLKIQEIKGSQKSLKEREQLTIFRAVMDGKSVGDIGAPGHVVRAAIEKARRLIAPYWEMRHEDDYLSLLGVAGMRRQKERVLACLELYEESKTE